MTAALVLAVVHFIPGPCLVAYSGLHILCFTESIKKILHYSMSFVPSAACCNGKEDEMFL